MLREALSRIFSSRVFYILFSVLASIVLWMYVEISVVQEKPYDVPNIPIVFRNEDVLRERGLLISSVNPQTVSLTFTVSRTVAAQLRPNNLSVEVDLSGINSTGPKLLEYSIIYPTGVNSRAITNITPSVELITLIVDQLSTVRVPVKVDYRGGTAADDLVADTPVFDPQVITVYGPDEMVSKISEARVQIYSENLESTYTADLNYLLYDDNGDELDAETLAAIKPSHDTIHVTIPIKLKKNIALNVEFAYGAGASSQNTDYSIEPQFVTVMGDPEALKDYNSITLGTIDTTQFRETNTYAFPIVYQNFVTPLSGETEAQVSVKILGLSVAYYSTSNLHYINEPANCRVEWVTQSLAVGIRGRQEDLDLISLANIRVVVDLKDREPGAAPFRIPATVYVDGISANVGAFDNYIVTLSLIREDG